MRLNYGSDSSCYGDAASKHYFTVDLVTEILDVADVGEHGPHELLRKCSNFPGLSDIRLLFRYTVEEDTIDEVAFDSNASPADLATVRVMLNSLRLK
jgi:hypothetical protein